MGIAVGIVLGGLITIGVAHLYYRRQARQQDKQFELLGRFLESFADATLGGKAIKVRWTRDKRGRIKNSSVAVKLKGDVTVSVTPGADMSFQPAEKPSDPTP